MVEPLAIFAGGLLGSAHCLGMCGGFAVTVSAGSNSASDMVRRQVTYSLGRIIAYSFLGAIAGFGGAFLQHTLGVGWRVQQLLSIIAGILMIIVALSTLNLLPRLRTSGGSGCNPAASIFKHFLTQPGTLGGVLAGAATGFLPCGLVYSFLSKSAAEAHVLGGVFTMMLFGLGTVPLMFLTGCSGAILSHTLRGRMMKLAACLVLAMGALTIYRGLPRPEGNCCDQETARTAIPSDLSLAASER